MKPYETQWNPIKPQWNAMKSNEKQWNPKDISVRFIYLIINATLII